MPFLTSLLPFVAERTCLQHSAKHWWGRIAITLSIQINGVSRRANRTNDAKKLSQPGLALIHVVKRPTARRQIEPSAPLKLLHQTVSAKMSVVRLAAMLDVCRPIVAK